MTLTKQQRLILDILAKGGALIRPGMGAQSYELLDPSRPMWHAWVRVSTVTPLWDTYITRSHSTAPIHLIQNS